MQIQEDFWEEKLVQMHACAMMDHYCGSVRVPIIVFFFFGKVGALSKKCGGLNQKKRTHAIKLYSFRKE